MLIIAMFFLSFSGCGYKADPYYLDEAPQGDDNIEFIMKKPNENNEDSDKI